MSQFIGGFWAKNIIAALKGLQLWRFIHPNGHRELFCGLSRADDGCVAGAPTQVACQSRIEIGLTGRMCCRHGCHKARGAKPTLRPVVGYHGLLHRVQRAVGSGQPLHRAHGAALQLGQK